MLNLYLLSALSCLRNNMAFSTFQDFPNCSRHETVTMMFLLLPLLSSFAETLAVMLPHVYFIGLGLYFLNHTIPSRPFLLPKCTDQAG